MSRLLLCTMVTLCACCIAQAAQNDPSANPFTLSDCTHLPNSYGYSELTHPLLDRVFPGLKFEKREIPNLSELVTYEISTSYDGKKWGMPSEFNLLSAEFKNESKASPDERIEAFVLLFFWHEGKEIRIHSKEKISQELYYHFNWRFTAEMTDENRSRTYEIEVIIAYDGQEILEIQIHFADGGSQIYNPKSVKYQGGSATDEVNLVISGPHVEHIQEEDYDFDPPDVYDHYYVQVSDNYYFIANNYVQFNVHGLTRGRETQLRVEPIFWQPQGAAFFDFSQPAQAGVTVFTWPITTYENTGVCRIKILDVASGNVLWNRYFTRIIPEHRILNSFPSSGEDYWVCYTNQAFILHPEGMDYADEYAELASQAMAESWEYEINQWDLCAGSNNGIPLDDDHTHLIAVNDGRVDIPGIFYHYTHTAQYVPQLQTQKVYGIGSRLIENFPLSQWYNPEADLVKTVVCHEFYHGIELTHNPIWPNYNYWMLEGQARFVPTVFMGEVSNPSGTNEEFDIPSLYHDDSNLYLQTQLNAPLVDLLHPHNGISYGYCLYWKFLWEWYLPGSGPDRFDIIREMCKGNTDPNMQVIGPFMDAKLLEGPGNYNNMEEALSDFAKRIYYNDPEFVFWTQPQVDQDFYIDPQNSGTITFTGEESIFPVGYVPSPWGIDFLKIIFDPQLDLQAATITANRDPLGNGLGQFAFLVFDNWDPLYGQPPYIATYSIDIPPAEEEGGVTFCNDIEHESCIDDAVVAVIRTDLSDISGYDDYEISVTSGVTITVDAVYPPVILSENGGTIDYTVRIKNNSNQGQDVYINSRCQGTAISLPVPFASYPQHLMSQQEIIQERTYTIAPYTQQDNYMLSANISSYENWDQPWWCSDGFAFNLVWNSAPDTQWKITHGGPYFDWGYGAHETESGNFRVIGFYDQDGADDLDLYYLNLSHNGAVLNADFYGTAANADGGLSIMPMSDGGSIIAGFYGSQTGPSAWLIRLNAIGSPIWYQTYDPGTKAECARQTSDGNTIAVGWDFYLGDFYLFKASSLSGTCLWENYIDSGFPNDFGRSVIQTSDLGYAFVGESPGGGTPYTTVVQLVKTDEDGDVEWMHPYGNMDCNYGWDLLQESDGGFVIAGITATYGSSPENHIYIIRTDAAGDVTWERVFDPGEGVHSIFNCNQGGGYIVAGSTGNAPDGIDAYVARLDEQGNERWDLNIDLQGVGAEGFESVAQNEDGGYILAGWAVQEKFNQDVLVVRLYPETVVSESFGIPPAYEVLSIPPSFSLCQCYPNPFNSSTTLDYALPQAEQVKMEIFNVAGQKVATLVDGYRQAGPHQVTWDASDLSAGVYFLQLQAGSEKAAQKLLLTK